MGNARAHQGGCTEGDAERLCEHVLLDLLYVTLSTSDISDKNQISPLDFLVRRGRVVSPGTFRIIYFPYEVLHCKAARA